jgi:hypothetical protein
MQLIRIWELLPSQPPVEQGIAQTPRTLQRVRRAGLSGSVTPVTRRVGFRHRKTTFVRESNRQPTFAQELFGGKHLYYGSAISGFTDRIGHLGHRGVEVGRDGNFRGGSHHSGGGGSGHQSHRYSPGLWIWPLGRAGWPGAGHAREAGSRDRCHQGRCRVDQRRGLSELQPRANTP